MVFAHGALRAAAWLSQQKPGLYNMENVLGLD
jgi:4-hydroxy-tetrahydrodipicolinate reductase